ncbi:ankyrin repeat domain-containing protein [Streptacidiphilus anmyonensis]|uniref:ankyrin repeat domain-containing protein n=1 Tax=Streptacidiphilus anmyonensis TaxID=405782 RepID=UPI0005AA1D11|nr:ankyrin repeat domain-containing protein [Streptacidiphilus anmyonensis]
MSDQIDPQVLEFAAKVFDLARGGDAATLAGYLDGGVPADLTNEAGDSLLMLAAYHGNVAAVRALLAHGADANRVNDRGQTPLAGAVFKGEREIVAALLAAGADPDAGAPSARAAAEMFGKTDLLG